MVVDTSRASERLRAWNEGDDDALPCGYTHDSLDFQRDLRALLARAEAAEKARDAAIQEMAAVARDLGAAQYQRDAALAERDRLAEAQKAAYREGWNDRESDFLSGVDRTGMVVVSAEALAQALREGMEDAARIAHAAHDEEGACHETISMIERAIRSAAGEDGECARR